MVLKIELVQSVYWGSVKFFKHIIFVALLFVIVLISILIINIFHFILRSTVNSPDEASISAAVSSTATTADINEQITMDSSDQTTIDIAEQVTVSSEEKPYQLLYPDLYCTKTNEVIQKDNTVYLTFDDGPSQQTLKILHVLKENNIKATFFVIGKTDDTSKEIMKQIVDEGHTLGIHSYTHNYEEIYNSVEAYLEDFYKIYNLIYQTTGVKSSIFRFPGGSINSYNAGIYQDIIDEMDRRGFTYFDWNVSSADTRSDATVESIYNNVMSQVTNHSRSIVLFHDSSEKSETVEALDEIIKDLLGYEYTLDSLSNQIRPIIFK